jgi:hypothetical protein
MAKTILPTATAAFVLLSGGAALAAEPVPAASAAAKPETPAWETEAATRRAGFSLGVLIGGAAGQITGYPNDVNKRGKTQFYADTGAALGGNLTLWLGGALTDWLVFGAGLSGTMATGNGILVQGLTFAFHTEIFPLFSLGGIWQEIGVGFDTGVGNFTGELENKPAGDAGKLIGPVMDSGAASRFAASVFYDGLRLSKISAGPFVSFDYSWSPTMERPLVVIGLRSALYVKAPKKK